MFTVELSGKHIIGADLTASGEKTFKSFNPSTGKERDTIFHEATSAEIDHAMKIAEDAFDGFRTSPAEDRAKLLDTIAEELMALGDDLLNCVHEESGLPMARCQGERARTVNQAKLFAQMVRDGSWVDARIDRANPDRQPLPKPDVRLMYQGIGPVVVFGASNFPMAIGVVGSDTVSALGAGCPVIVKGHRAHPGTSELCARAVQNAVKKCGLPAGIFSMLQGSGRDLGMALVKHPVTQAVAFTGSLSGGRALFDAANARPNPIPVYAEMGSINPVFVLPGAVKERGEQIAQGYIQSVTMGTGQFCTNPGLLIGLKDESLPAFSDAVSKSAKAAAPATMLTPMIQKSFKAAVESFQTVGGVSVLGQSETPADDAKTEGGCNILATDADTFLKNPKLSEECFGPASIFIQSDSKDKMEEIAEGLEQQLTATIHGTVEDIKNNKRLIQILERKVGRLVYNGFPTGIEVCAAMHHGAGYPAATHSHFTSIGTGSILRFVKPMCYQNFPDEALPLELQNGNPRNIWRLVDNEMTRDAI